MRDRHLPRLCRPCQAPMGRQENACWRCGTDWATEDDARTVMRVLPGGAAAPASNERAATLARWSDEGGSLGSEEALPVRAAADGS